MKAWTFFTILFFTSFLYGQVSPENGEKIKFGKITLVNEEILEFYNLEYQGNEKVTFINTENLQNEFLYVRSIKTIAEEDVSEEKITQIERKLHPENFESEITYSVFDYKNEEIKIQNPKPGKAVVYFVRTNSSAFLINFRHFHYDKFIGKFSGMGLIRYECEPGEQVFWVSAQNAIFVKANLEADKIYMIEVFPTASFGYSQVRLGIPKKHEKKNYEKQRNRLLSVFLNDNSDKTMSQSELNSTQSQYANEIQSALKKFKKREKREQYYILNADQYFE